MYKAILVLARIIACLPGFRRAASYAWMPIGSLKFRISYRKACHQGKVYLHLGAGFVRLDGWLNTDILPICPLYLDAKRRLPIRDNTVSYIFGEHFLEYLSRRAALALFKESYRVLQSGGVLRITTIDIEALARAYLSNHENVRLLNDRNRQLGYHYSSYPIDILNKTYFEDGNVCEYDAQTIQRFFNEAGFQNIIHCQVGVSFHSALSGIERHDVGSILEKFVCVTEGTKWTAPF
jgi:predicted SAM-dependent methyltransferase